jgi:colanic acid biosynthesis glycosyl transferase WcaI
VVDPDTTSGAAAAGTRGRIIYLSQLFDPEPTFKGLSFAKALVERGFDLEVVTGFPNYPGGKIYEGYEIMPIQRQVMDGVPVTRLAIYPSHDRSAIKRVVCYVSFMISSATYLLFGARRADLIYVFYPSLTAGLAAAFAKLFRRTPIWLDIQDMWPDSLGATGMMNNRIVLRMIDFLCGILYRYVDHITVLSSGFRELLMSRGVPGDKISIVYNWAEETELETIENEPVGFDPDDRFRILFAGNMGAAQGLKHVLDAAAMLLTQQPHVRFYFLGAGLEVEQLKEQAVRQKLSNVRFLPRVPLAQVQSFLAAADCLLVHLTSDPLFKITIPSKTQAYLYAGKPILMAVEGDAAKLIADADAGLVCAPENASELVTAILALDDCGPERRVQMGKNGRQFYDLWLSFETNIIALSTHIDGVKRVSDRQPKL